MVSKKQIRRCAEDTSYFVALYFGTKDHRMKPEEKESIKNLIEEYERRGE